MCNGELTSVELCQFYLERIGTYDRQGPVLNSVIELNPDALEQAEQFNLERSKKRFRGPLHGIPILIKDNIDTADREWPPVLDLWLWNIPMRKRMLSWSGNSVMPEQCSWERLTSVSGPIFARTVPSAGGAAVEDKPEIPMIL